MNTEEEVNELKKRVAHLEDTVQEIIDWSQRVFGPPQDNTGGQGEETTADDLFEVISFDVKKKPAEMVGDHWTCQSYAWKLTVKNKCPQKITLIGTVVFLDSDGFDVATYPMEVLEIKANATETSTGLSQVLDQHQASQVKEVTCKFDVR